MLSNKALAISGSLAGSALIGVGIAYLTDSSKFEEPLRVHGSAEENTLPVTTKQKISDLLDKDGRILLDNDPTEWTQNWNKFKEKYSAEKAPEAPWEISDWKDAFSADKVSEKFKTKCKENSEKLVENDKDPLYTDVKENCTKTRDV